MNSKPNEKKFIERCKSIPKLQITVRSNTINIRELGLAYGKRKFSSKKYL